jgi:hypothetical protein
LLTPLFSLFSLLSSTSPFFDWNCSRAIHSLLTFLRGIWVRPISCYNCSRAILFLPTTSCRKPNVVARLLQLLWRNFPVPTCPYKTQADSTFRGSQLLTRNTVWSHLSYNKPSSEVVLKGHLREAFPPTGCATRCTSNEVALYALSCCCVFYEEVPFPLSRQLASKRCDQAGLTLPQNNGLVEGKVNKLKLIKRMGYGRAEFPLLRQRVLHAL